MCMVELGQLESRHEDFASRNVRVLAASLDGDEDSAAIQALFPHLTIVSDPQGELMRAAEVLGPHKGPDGREVASPTTILINRQGRVVWTFRPDRYINRLPAADLLAAVDEHLPRQP